MLYRIYTENVGHTNAEYLAKKAFDAITVIQGIGYWKREREESVIIEILTDDCEGVKALAERIRKMNKQEAVLIVAIAADSILVTA
jgi:hypothetical protein